MGVCFVVVCLIAARFGVGGIVAIYITTGGLMVKGFLNDAYLVSGLGL